MKLVGERSEDLVADLERAVGELEAAVSRAPGRWTRARPGKWTGGQHAEHLAIALERFADALEAADLQQRAGNLPAPPARDFVQRLFVKLAVEQGHMPRGAKTPAEFHPGERPQVGEVLARVRAAVARHAALLEGRSPEQQDRLWIANPFLPRWRYTLPEALRVHAVHVRHHLAQFEEIPLA